EVELTVVEVLPQLGTGGDVLVPLVVAQALLLHAPRPQTVHQDAVLVSGTVLVEHVVDALEGDLRSAHAVPSCRERTGPGPHRRRAGPCVRASGAGPVLAPRCPQASASFAAS